jgi:magnesium chelatase family protein
VRARVTASWKRQQERFKDTNLNSNADMTAADVRTYCQVEDSAQSLLKAAMKQLNLSA